MNTLTGIDPGFVAQHPGYTTQGVGRWVDGNCIQGADHVAEEVPVALVYNGISHAVMMTTPNELDDFALGFSLTEGILRCPEDLHSIDVQADQLGHRVQMVISKEGFRNVKQRRRSLIGRTSCGICGIDMLEQAIRQPPRLTDGIRVPADSIHNAFGQLKKLQTLQHVTGAVHAAGWATCDGELHLIREDVGRHNALDKLIGALARQSIPAQNGFIVITSRASYEIAQKAAMANIELIAAISAPTALAIRLAEQARLTLIGFSRQHNHVVYSHPNRVIPTLRPTTS